MQATPDAQNLVNTKTREQIIPAGLMPFSPPRQLGEFTISIAPLWRDPATQANSMLVKLTKGRDPFHYHPHDFYLIVLEGEIIHLSEGLTGTEKVTLGPGSYYFQPAKTIHQDICVTDEALVFCALLGDGGTIYADALTRPKT